MPSTPGDHLPGRQREARANDSAVLAAAREVFAHQGHGASMADVARHAGVGVGTVYRRYPTKDALVEALHTEAVRVAAALAATVADAPGADGAVVTFLARHVHEAEGSLLRPTGAATPIPPDLAAATADLHDALRRLVELDQDAGVVPAGFTAADVMLLLLHLRPALPLPRERADELHLRYLALAARGLRDQAADGALHAGPGWDEWVGTWHA
jgi:AcrR family transcriptional regulator